MLTGKGFTSAAVYITGLIVAGLGIFGGPEAVSSVGGEAAVEQVVSNTQVAIGGALTFVGKVIALFSNDTKKV